MSGKHRQRTDVPPFVCRQSFTLTEVFITMIGSSRLSMRRLLAAGSSPFAAVRPLADRARLLREVLMMTTSFVRRQTVRRILIALVVILSSSCFRSKAIGDDESA